MFYVLIFSLAAVILIFAFVSMVMKRRRTMEYGDESGQPRRLGPPFVGASVHEQLGAPQPQGTACAVTARQAQASLSLDHRLPEALERLYGVIE